MPKHRAMFLALLAYFLWVWSDTSSKLAGQASLSPFLVMAILGGVSLILSAGASAYQRNLSLLLPVHGRTQAAIASSVVVNSIGTIIALKHLPLTIFFVSVFTAPLVISFVSSLLKHEKLSWVKIICLIIGFAGVVFAIVSRDWAGGEGIGYLGASVSVAGFSVYTILIRKISHSSTTESMLFWNALAIAFVGVLGCFFQKITAPALVPLVILIGGSIANQIANIFYTRSLRHTAASNVAQLHYTQLIFGALFGYIFWHEIPTENLLVGSAMIVMACLVVAAQKSAEKP